MAATITTYFEDPNNEWEEDEYDIIAACHEISTSIKVLEEEAARRAGREPRSFVGGKWSSYQRCVGEAAGSRKVEAMNLAKRSRWAEASSRMKESKRAVGGEQDRQTEHCN